MATNVVVTIVMAVAVTMDANTDADAADMNTDDCRIGCTCTQQGQGKY